MTAAARCADVADAAGDAREGSAPPAQQWFLLEHPGPWGRFALHQSGVHAAAVAALSSWSARVGGRVVLVRRPGRDGQAGGVRRWWRVDARPGHEQIRTGPVTDEAALFPDDPGEPFEGPLYLVCTHGRHDTCCAIRGRPLAGVLAAEHPGRVLESSHIGGCRFAAAMVLLPHGLTLGGVPASAALEVARAYDGGQVDPRFVRGRSAHRPAVQAAQQFARVALGVSGVDALRPVDAAGAGGTWRVRFVDPDVTVVVAERHLPAHRPLTCAATVPGDLREFALVEIRPGG